MSQNSEIRIRGQKWDDGSIKLFAVYSDGSELVILVPGPTGRAKDEAHAQEIAQRVKAGQYIRREGPRGPFLLVTQEDLWL
jgi:hypothetical protein